MTSGFVHEYRFSADADPMESVTTSGSAACYFENSRKLLKICSSVLRLFLMSPMALSILIVAQTFSGPAMSSYSSPFLPFDLLYARPSLDSCSGDQC